MSSLHKFHRRTQPFKVNTLHTGTVTISGTAAVGSTLSVTSTITDVDGLGTFAYQWKRSGSAISGATSSTYTLVAADNGNTITVTITYTDGKGFIEIETSAATASVIVPNTLHTGTVTISGTAAVGSVLTASNNIADADGLGTFAYQWKRSGSAISGATSSTYTLVSADGGNTMTVTITYTDGKGFIETETSAATASVTVPPDSVTVTSSMGDGSGDATKGFYLAGYSDGKKMYVAPKSTEATLLWGSAGVNRWTRWVNDGYANTDNLVYYGTASHPAAGKCKYLTTGGYNTWYMPARYELDAMFNNKTKTPFATANGFLGAYYASSTETDNSVITTINMANGRVDGSASKNSTFPVRAIRRSTI